MCNYEDTIGSVQLVEIFQLDNANLIMSTLSTLTSDVRKEFVTRCSECAGSNHKLTHMCMHIYLIITSYSSNTTVYSYKITSKHQSSFII